MVASMALQLCLMVSRRQNDINEHFFKGELEDLLATCAINAL
jgi:hypothetical protein